MLSKHTMKTTTVAIGTVVQRSVTERNPLRVMFAGVVRLDLVYRQIVLLNASYWLLYQFMLLSSSCISSTHSEP
jgi:hypothetical protein